MPLSRIHTGHFLGVFVIEGILLDPSFFFVNHPHVSEWKNLCRLSWHRVRSSIPSQRPLLPNETSPVDGLARSHLWSFALERPVSLPVHLMKKSFHESHPIDDCRLVLNEIITVNRICLGIDSVDSVGIHSVPVP